MNQNPRNEEREALGDNDASIPEDDDDDSFGWSKFNALCLDGGGIRGLWSLLVLKALMGFIAEIEIQNGHDHSFDPSPWPNELTDNLTDKEKEARRNFGGSDNGNVGWLRRDRRYFPCHYFDYICGSSTGALIAIMLGRLRMTVADCIVEYTDLAQAIFGNPRRLNTMRFAVGDRQKYDHKAVEKVFQDVVNRRNNAIPGDPPGKVLFPMRRGSCATFVTSEKSRDNNVTGSLYLIRSYDYKKPRPANRGKRGRPSRASTRLSNMPMQDAVPSPMGNINYGAAQNYEIWEVARAATAAVFHFKPWKIPDPNGRYPILLRDGGLSSYNNPTEIAKNEIEGLHGEGSTDIVVSVGTAKMTRPQKDTGFFTRVLKFIKYMAENLSDTEQVHVRMQQECDKAEGRDNAFQYHRFNDHGAVDVEMDGWKPRKSGSKKASGAETVDTIESKVHAYLSRNEVSEDMRACAVRLVDCRMKRLKKPDWDCYANAALYKCSLQRCFQPEFSNAKDLEDHLRNKHPFTQEEDANNHAQGFRERWEYQQGNRDRT